MGGGGRGSTTHHTTQTPNDYNDAWIRQKFDTIDQRYNDFSSWKAGREATIGFEGRQRDANAALLTQLQGDFRKQASTLEGLSSKQQQLGSDFRGLGDTTTSRFQDLTDAQRQQFKDIYNLGQAGPGKGVKTKKLTQADRTAGGAYGGFNRGGMRIQSLNI